MASQQPASAAGGGPHSAASLHPNTGSYTAPAGQMQPELHSARQSRLNTDDGGDGALVAESHVTGGQPLLLSMPLATLLPTQPDRNPPSNHVPPENTQACCWSCAS